MLAPNLAVKNEDRRGDLLVSVPVDSFRKSAEHYRSGPVIVDLFGGAGGFSLGFALSGGRIAAAVEIDNWACDTLRANHPETKVVQGDIAFLTSDYLFELGGKADVIIGGPPCQGFSVANIRARDTHDPRNSLFQEFIRAVEICRPKALLMENVPGLLRRRTANGEHVVDVIQNEIRRIGYFPYVQVLQAMDYGVPQLRPRLFVLGLRKPTNRPFPPLTHAVKSNGHGSLFYEKKVLKNPVTLWQAISDLPRLEAREGAEVLDYSTDAENDFQALLRADSEKLYNHKAMRHSPRLIERFSKLEWGQSGADAPVEHGARRRGNPNELSGKPYDQNNRRMYPDRPCHTIPASFYANFVHPFVNRNFTPREGARLQSFPDWYRFLGKPTVVSHRLLGREGRKDELHLCQYNQIGNAVPPLLAFHLGKHVSELI